MLFKRLTGAAFLAALAVGASQRTHADDSTLSPEVRALIQRLESTERELELLKNDLRTTKETQKELADSQSRLTDNQAKMIEISASNFEALEAAKAEAPKPNDLSMSASWKDGFEVATKDKAFRVHVGGRTQLDTSWYAVDDGVDATTNPKYQDGVDFRRARLRIDGTMYEQIEWAVEYDFINSSRVRNSAGTGTADLDVTGFTDVWWTFKEVPCVGNIRIGNQKEAIGFEHVVSSRFLPFMERSYNQDTFYGGAFNGFTPGISIFDHYDDEMGTWNIGLYKPTNNVFAANASNGDYAVTGRLTRLLWWENDGRELLHLGISGRQFTTVNDQIRYRTRDAIRAGISSQWPLPGDTGTLFGDQGQWINTEFVVVQDRWTFQSEYLASFLQDAGKTATTRNQDLFYHGGYVQVMYFLTDDHDSYDRKERASFGRVKPKKNFRFLRTDPCDCYDGWGAWQVGVRYNYLDLNDKGINGGELNNYTAGLNWFLNPNMKIQANYMLTEKNSNPTSAGEGMIHGWGFRFAHDF